MPISHSSLRVSRFPNVCPLQTKCVIDRLAKPQELINQNL